MKILLLEDEAPAARRLERLLAKTASQAEVVGVLASVGQGMAWMDANPAPDLILADIELADGRCFELFRQRPPQAPVIFTTAYDAFALEAFEHNGIAYLLKPIEEGQLRSALDKLEKLRSSGSANAAEVQQKALAQLLAQMAPQQPKAFRERFLLKFGDRYVPLELRDVAYFEASEKLVFAHTAESRRLPLDETLDELEREVDPASFFRVNRGTLASRGAIRQIAAHFNGRLKLALYPAPAEDVFVSRERAGAFRDWMNR